MTVEPPRAARFGWVFAAVWLFYLGENLSALLDQPPGWRRDVGLAALAAFALLYLVMIGLLRRIRSFPWYGTRQVVIRVWLGLLGMLALTALQVPAIGYHALTCLVYIAATAMMALPVAQAIPVAVVLVIIAEASARLLPGWEDNGYGWPCCSARWPPGGSGRPPNGSAGWWWRSRRSPRWRCRTNAPASPATCTTSSATR